MDTDVRLCDWCDEAPAEVFDADWHDCEFCGGTPQVCLPCAAKRANRKWADIETDAVVDVAAATAVAVKKE